MLVVYTSVQTESEQLTLKGGVVELVYDVSCRQNYIFWEKFKNRKKDVKNVLEKWTYLYV